MFIVSYSSDNVQYVNSNGNVNYNWYDNVKSVRPFWDEIEKMKKKRKTMERDINKREDEIDEMNDRLQAEIREKLKGNSTITHIMTIGFKIK